MANPLSDRQAILDPATPLDALPPDKLVLQLAEVGRILARHVET